ncbi:hypothetical protein D3C73_1243500 [compost metagenome]
MEQLVAKLQLPLRVLVLLLLLASYWGAYQHGRTVEQTKCDTATAARDSGDRLAELLGERDARQEEQRRAQAQEEARANAQEERTIVDASVAGADVAGQRCTTKLHNSPPPSLALARIPPLSPK